MKPWNIKPGMLIKVPTLGGMGIREVDAVEKMRRHFGSGYMWKIYFFDCGRLEAWLVFSDYNIEVRKEKVRKVK